MSKPSSSPPLHNFRLQDGGTILYEPGFLNSEEADDLLATLQAATPWQQEKSRGRLFPRLTAWYADAGLRYSYSGVTHSPLTWTPQLQAIRQRVERAAKTNWNSLLLNLYRDRDDSIGMHADDEPELGTNPIIGSLSLGASRRFVLTHNRTREKLEFNLGHGSFLIMGGACQHYWKHGVPKTRKPTGVRINLTFRQIVEILERSIKSPTSRRRS